MDTLTVWTLILMLTVISFASRASFVLLFARVALPHLVQRALHFVPVAVFPALVVPDIFLNSGVIDLGPSNLKAAAAILAGLVAWKTHNTLATIVVGMAALHLLRLAILG